MTFFIGIDPGLKGAIAVLDTEGSLFYLRDMPTRQDCSKNIVDILELNSDSALKEILLSGGIRVAIERLQSLGGNDKMSSHSIMGMGKSAGRIEGFIEAQGILPTMVVPTVWKRYWNLLKQDKKSSVYLARQIWPSKDDFLISKDGRADAALIAYWLRDKFS